MKSDEIDINSCLFLKGGNDLRIKEIKIEKFRSIKKASFRMNNITAVVGENNAGKTSVLKAINSVLNYKDEESSFLNQNHRYAPRNNTHITIVFDEIPNKKLYEDKVNNNTLTIKFSYIYSENKKKYTLIKGRKEENLDDSFMEDLSKDLLYVYIPAGRSNKDIRWNQGSIFKKLLLEYTEKYTENRDVVSGYVRKATDKIHNSMLVKLEKQLNLLYMQNKSMDFKIDFPENIDYIFLLGRVELSLNQDESNYLLEEWGSGTKSLAVIAMHRAHALLNGGSIVLGIEEPETNLHPQAQKRFILSLNNKLYENEIQAIFTTHSTVLVDELPHESILLLRRRKDGSKRMISQISQLSSDFWRKYNIEEFKHYQYFHYKNSDFFFSKYVVLAESKNDCQVFKSLITPEIKDNIADISFLDAAGIENVKYPFFLLKELQIPFTMIVDRDFFFPYINNNELERSRNTITGLPMYSDELKNDEIIRNVFKTSLQRELLVSNHKKGYRSFFDFIKSYGILSMNYCLEMDLTCSKEAREIYYNRLSVIDDKRTQKELLVNNKKAIKSIKHITVILDSITKKSYPESYKKIKNYLVDQIKQI